LEVMSTRGVAPSTGCSAAGLELRRVRRPAVLVLALLAYLGAVAIDTNGFVAAFVAAFVAGTAFGAFAGRRGEKEV